MARLSRGSEGNSGCTRRVVRRVAGRVELRGRYICRKKEMGKNRGDTRNEEGAETLVRGWQEEFSQWYVG